MHCCPDLAKWIVKFEETNKIEFELPEYQIESNSMLTAIPLKDV